MKKAIAIDYDNTLSLNPTVFRKYLVPLARELKREIIIATSRYGTSDDLDLFIKNKFSEWAFIIWCGNDWKVDACKKAGYEVVIWIDDCPEGDRPGGILSSKIIGVWKWIMIKLSR
jgi:hypothetical protein